MIDFLKKIFNILVITLLLLLLIFININIYKPQNKKLIKRVTVGDNYYEGYCNKNCNKKCNK